MTENSKENMINKISYNNQKQLLYNLLSKSQIDNSKAISLFVDILKLEPQNRRNSEIQIVIPYIQTLYYFNEFLTLKEEKESFIKLINEFVWVLSYEKYEKNTIIKRPKEFPEKFYLILNGTVGILDLVVTKECLTEEQYMKYLIKMKLLNEEEIIEKCIKYNQDILKIDTTDIEKYCNSGYKFKYNILKLEVLRDLYKHNFNIEDYTNKVLNLEEYIFSTKVINDVRKKSEDKNTNKKYFYLLHYEQIGIMKTGRYFGDLCIKNLNKERVCFIALEDTDIGYVDKLKYERPKLYLPIEKKKERYIDSYINSFYIFRQVNSEIFCNNYAKYFIYKRYTKGEKLFIQNSFYDGVYLIIDGLVNVYTDRQINEISGLMVSLQYSLDGFSEFLSCLKNDKINNNKEDFIKNPVYHTKEYSELSKGQKRIYLNKLGNFEIIGLNEYYSFSTLFIHFTVEIISEDAIIIFIPKKIFYKIITSLRDVLFSLKEIVELRSRYYIGKLKNYKDSLINDINNKLITTQNKRSKTSSEKRKNNRYQDKKELFHRRNNSPNLIDNIIKNDNKNRNLNQTFSQNHNKKFISIFNKTHSTNFNNTLTNFNKTQSTNFNQTYSSNFNHTQSSNLNNPIIDNSNNMNTKYTFTEPTNKNNKITSFNFFRKNNLTSTNFNNHKQNVLKKNMKISAKAFMSGFPFSVIKPEQEENKNILPIIKSFNY